MGLSVHLLNPDAAKVEDASDPRHRRGSPAGSGTCLEPSTRLRQGFGVASNAGDEVSCVRVYSLLSKIPGISLVPGDIGLDRGNP